MVRPVSGSRILKVSTPPRGDKYNRVATGNNKFGSKRCIKCDECRRRKTKCVFDNKENKCRDCKRRGVSCRPVALGERRVAGTATEFLKEHAQSVVQLHQRLCDSDKKSSNYVEHILMKRPVHPTTNIADVAEDVICLLKDRFPNMSSSAILTAVQTAAASFRQDSNATATTAPTSPVPSDSTLATLPPILSSLEVVRTFGVNGPHMSAASSMVAARPVQFTSAPLPNESH